MRNPLKQGLKHSQTHYQLCYKDSRNAKSTKTRIETRWVYCGWYIKKRRNAKSTKTRIETLRHRQLQNKFIMVAMRNPLKQGLKQEWKGAFGHGAGVAMRNPLKQGLKRRLYKARYSHTESRNAKSTKTRIETQSLGLSDQLQARRNAKSTKTRIETPELMQSHYHH